MHNRSNLEYSIKVVLFDFDGTLSTLRTGWEGVMAPFMKEMILGSHLLSKEKGLLLQQEIDTYIDQSTGIQTVFQMQWLVKKVRDKGWNQKILDQWDYKKEYNRRLLLQVKNRLQYLQTGKSKPEEYLMKGTLTFLKLLQDHGIEMYMASGTDHPDVINEAKILGVASYFKEITGAPVGREDCSKEKVMRDLLAEKKIAANELAVIGDGKVEIGLGKACGGLSMGLASNEEKREGINPVKHRRLLEAGADWITGDFLNQDEWIQKLGLLN